MTTSDGDGTDLPVEPPPAPVELPVVPAEPSSALSTW